MLILENKRLEKKKRVLYNKYRQRRLNKEPLLFYYEGKEHLRKHHLYVCPEDSPELRRHLKFRDYLRMHPEAVQEYSRIKEEGAALYPDDMDKYIAHKAPVIQSIYEKMNRKESVRPEFDTKNSASTTGTGMNRKNVSLRKKRLRS